MMFSTKAEYGIRIMAHLAAYDGDGPVSLSAIADAEGLPGHASTARAWHEGARAS